MRAAWRAVLDDLPDAEQRQVSAEVALLATGAYGLRQLSLFEPVQIVLLLAGEGRALLERVAHALFDELRASFAADEGVPLEASAVLGTEVGNLERETVLSLLEARPLAGSAPLFKEASGTLAQHLDVFPFVSELIAQWVESRGGVEATPYTAEPNVVNGPGGLRDLRLMRWLAVACHRVPAEETWNRLAARELLSPRVAEDLAEAQALWLALRAALEALTGGAAFALTHAQAEQVASLWQQESTAELMVEVYGLLEVTARAAERFAAAARNGRFPLGSGLAVAGGMLGLVDAEAFRTAPGHLVRAFQLAHEHGLALHDGLTAAIAEAVRVAPMPDREAHDRFLVMLRQERVAETLTGMAATGVLGWLVPEWAKLRVQYAAEGAQWTPGEVGLRAARALEVSLDDPEGAARRAWARVEAPEAVRLALLLQGLPAEQVSGAVRSLGCDLSVVSMAAFLVARKTLLATVGARDRLAGEGMDTVTAAVPSAAYLDALLLFAVARRAALGEPRHAGPGAIGIERVAEEARGRLEGRPSAVREGTPPLTPPRTRGGAETTASSPSSLRSGPSPERREGTEDAEVSAEAIEAHATTMPASYLFNTPWARLADHVRAAERARAGSPVIEFRDDATGTELFLCTRDAGTPGLLSRVAGVLYAHHVNIHAAQVYTRGAPEALALDTLRLDVAGKALTEAKQHEVAADLVAALGGRLEVEPLIRQHGRALQVPITVASLVVRNAAEEEHTLVELVAQDREGLLYHVARALAAHGLNIRAAKVTTWAGWGRDAFYVVDATNARLLEADLAGLTAALRAAIESG